MKKTYKLITVFFVFLVCLPHKSLASDVQIINGNSKTKAWLIESHTIPIVTARITFKNSGAAYDPDEYSGLAYFTTLMLDEGAGDVNGPDFKRKMSELAANYSFSADKDNFYITIKSLRKSFRQAIKLISQAIKSPLLEQEAINRSKEQIIVSLQKKDEDPYYVGKRKWEEIVFNNHPYSKPLRGRKETIQNITKINLHNFVSKHFTKDKIVLSFVGDIQPAEVEEYIGEYFSDLPESGALNEIEKFADFPIGKTHPVKKSLPQSIVIFGQQSVDIKDRDFYPLHIFNYVMGGGGFESRLMKELREKRGLAYSANSYLRHEDKASVLEGYFATKHSKIDESLKVFSSEIGKLKKEGITTKELSLAKSYTLGSFPLKLDSYEKLVNYLNFMQIKNLGPDFLKTRNDRVRSVSLDDVERIRKKIFSPDKMTIVVVGRN